MFPLSASNFSELFSLNQILIFVGISILNSVLLIFASSKFMLSLQQCGYHGKRYFKWLYSKDTPYLNRLMLLCLLGLLFFCVLSICFAPILSKEISSYLGFVSYALFTIMYINSEAHINKKIGLKKTARMIRLGITFSLVLAAVTFGLISLFNYLAFTINDEVIGILRFAPLCLMPLLTPFLLFIAYCLNEPFEWIMRTYYINKTTAKLANTKAIKIGITGSFAKTSVKEILKVILSQKYRVLATPQSFNTPLGIVLATNKLDSTHDVFIAEMGARQVGDIYDLAKIVNPDFAVLTGVNSQHLETFKTKDNILQTKFELFENLKSGGIGFFSSDNEGAKQLYDKFNGEKVKAGLGDDGDDLVNAEIEKIDENGTTFILKIKGEKSVRCTTVLLGRHSISNICLASAVAYKLGMTAKEIAEGINRLRSIDHRLEILPNRKGIVVIDDSYNANVDGTRAALEVLSSFSGRKIVLTPGIVEMGKMENVENLELGKALAKSADYVIVIGKHNAEMLIDGLIEGGMPRENIAFEKNLERGNEKLNSIMKEGDVVLFENDLPDTYN